MWGSFVLFAALCLAGNIAGVSSQDAMGRLHWCSTLCMCDESSEVVKCFERNDIYDLLSFHKVLVIKLERTNWQLENKVTWCNDTCLCYQNDNPNVFKCVNDTTLRQFISERIGDMYFYKDGEVPQVRDEDKAMEEKKEEREVSHHKRQKGKGKNRRKHRQRNRGKNRQEASPPPVTESTTTPVVTEVVTELSTTTTEAVLVTTTQEAISLVPSPTKGIFTSGPQTQMAHTTAAAMPPAITTTTFTPTTTTTFLTQIETTPEPEPEPVAEEEEDTEVVAVDEYDVNNYEEEAEEDEDAEGEAELLPKQEAVAASPAVTAMQPPTRRQPFPPTVSSHAITRDAPETLAPKSSAVLEVPVQRKTVALEVSQDLDELGRTVKQIKNDVVLNQRILLVTVAVAGIAMLGVLMLAVHSCFASRRQAAAEEKRKRNEAPKDDNHVTKVNLEEAW